MSKSKRGGARPGAGRKKRSVKHAGPVATAEQRIADQLPQLIDNMMTLAHGGYQRVEEEWTPNPLDGDADGDDLPATAQPLVLTKRKVSVAEPDRTANQYLIDRILGRPRQSVEVGGNGRRPIPITIEALISQVYGDPACDTSS